MSEKSSEKIKDLFKPAEKSSMKQIGIYSLLLLGGFLIGLIIGSCGVLKYEEDNPLEEKIEEVIKEKTDVDLDLSPFSDE
jgi:hypothetical protein